MKIVRPMEILGVLFLSWTTTKTTLAQNTTVSPNNTCLPGNTNNNNLKLYGLSGTFESPRDPYNSQFYPGMSCDWLITVPEGSIVKLSFELFDMDFLATGSPLWYCSGDYVEVLKGNKSDSGSRGKLCGLTNPGIIRSSGRYMLVRFRSDFFSTPYQYYKGFNATFTAENKLICPYNGEALTASVSHQKTLTNPGYPLAPVSLLPSRCRWILEVPDELSTDGAYILKVTFNDFNLQEYYDKLTFHDGISSASKRLGKSYTGRVHPDVLYSTGRHLFVDFSVEGKPLAGVGGFSLNFSAVVREEALGVCQSLDGNAKRNRLTGSSGSLFSPFYPVPYPTNSSCIWVISVPANKRVKLIFDKIEIDRKDHVQILDGRKSWSKELAVYHGYNLFSTGSAVYSTRKYMRIQFHSYQGSSDYAGFKAHFEAVDPPVSSEQTCFPGNIYNNNLKLSGYNGTLQSPTGGEGYLSHSSCNWLIAVPEGYYAKLSFDTFQLVQTDMSGRCDADYVEVVDGEDIYGDSEGKMCGSNAPKEISSTGRYMRVLFRSGPIRSSFRGLKATFTALHDPPKTKAVNSYELCYPGNVHNYDLRLTGSEGILESPLTHYPPSLFCEWLITVPEEHSIELSFERFQLDPEGCRDYVEVGDGLPFSDKSLGRYCGTTIPKAVSSSHRNRYMWVQFYSDADYVGRKPHSGFKATFKAISSSESRTLVTAVIVSVILFVALICLLVCLAKRSKRRNREAAERIRMAPVSRRTQSEPFDTTTPPVDYVPNEAPTNADIPPPDYPYPLESPPPYPGKGQIPQFPPPGQSYPWLQSASAEESAIHENENS
ncbi:tolloid-like protein 1 isoform X2 [Stylophora pistillata]|uniref:tolloid-like protein 1 isoform X2 n=1 Tax=Stylophora pistillata TaxID=50429 RepID=UPI000C04F3C5|nr:tolloid-like protein 1 isoform X2 [Stylophora pistillata]